MQGQLGLPAGYLRLEIGLDGDQEKVTAVSPSLEALALDGADVQLPIPFFLVAPVADNAAVEVLPNQLDQVPSMDAVSATHRSATDHLQLEPLGVVVGHTFDFATSPENRPGFAVDVAVLSVPFPGFRAWRIAKPPASEATYVGQLLRIEERVSQSLVWLLLLYWESPQRCQP